MIRSMLTINGHHQKGLSYDEIRSAFAGKQELLWVSLEEASPEEIDAILKDIFNFHPLAIEDCQSVGYQSPKVDDFGSYLFMVMHALQIDPKTAELSTMEMDIFLGETYLVTSFRGGRFSAVDEVWRRLERDERLINNGSDFLCHSILDVMVDEMMPVLDNMDDEIELLEDRVLVKPEPRVLERIMDLKHNIMTMRRIISPQREVINRLSRDPFPMIDEHSRIYFRDIYDHLVRLQDLSEALRDIVTGALDIYLNSTSLRLNEVMKALTVVSTIFLPLSFVAGVYGMNFDTIFPSFHWQYGFAFFIGICLSIIVGMLYFFKRRGWF